MLLGLPIGFCFLSNLFLFCDEYKLTELFCCWQIVFSAIRRCVFGHINYFNLDIAHLVFFVTLVLFLHFINVKKLWFIHALTAHYTSKTAKTTKR